MNKNTLKNFISLIIKEEIQKLSASPALQEGGLGGHMSHIHENKNLTFSQIEEIFNLATSGKLESVTEKLDGQNMFFTYNVSSDQVLFARNKTHVKDGGMNASDIASKWSETAPKVSAAFGNAYHILNQAFSVIDPQTLISIFGPNGDTWYSMEVLYSGNPNVINYGQDAIVFHEVSLTKDEEGNVVPNESFNESFSKLNSIIENLQSAVEEQQWSIFGPVLVQLKDATDKKAHERASAALKSEISKYNLGSSDTIGNYLAEKFKEVVLQNEPYSEKVKEQLANIFASDLKPGQKKSEAANLLKNSEDVEKYFAAPQQYKLENVLIAPIEKIIHDFAVELLEGVHSALVLNPDEEVKRLKNTVGQQIEKIKTSGDENAMEVLQKNLKKLGGVDNITSSMEGIVFKFGDRAYKLSGNFAPINKLLGIFRY